MPINLSGFQAPTTAQIAAAVNAPSAATIAAAVAAPSAATIASTVAGSVPTLTQINTSVANNASPFGGTWTNVGLSNPTNVSSVTFSSLSGYKFYRLYISTENHTDSAAFYMRINGDSSSNYNYFYANSQVGSNVIRGNNTFQFQSSSFGSRGFFIDFPYANSTTVDKQITVFTGQSGGGEHILGGIYSSTAAINSIHCYINLGTCNWYARLFGAN